MEDSTKPDSKNKDIYSDLPSINFGRTPMSGIFSGEDKRLRRPFLRSWIAKLIIFLGIIAVVLLLLLLNQGSAGL